MQAFTSAGSGAKVETAGLEWNEVIPPGAAAIQWVPAAFVAACVALGASPARDVSD